MALHSFYREAQDEKAMESMSMTVEVEGSNVYDTTFTLSYFSRRPCDINFYDLTAPGEDTIDNRVEFYDIPLSQPRGPSVVVATDLWICHSFFTTQDGGENRYL